MIKVLVKRIGQYNIRRVVLDTPDNRAALAAESVAVGITAESILAALERYGEWVYPGGNAEVLQVFEVELCLKSHK